MCTLLCKTVLWKMRITYSVWVVVDGFLWTAMGEAKTCETCDFSLSDDCDDVLEMVVNGKRFLLHGELVLVSTFVLVLVVLLPELVLVVLLLVVALVFLVAESLVVTLTVSTAGDCNSSFEFFTVEGAAPAGVWLGEGQ